MIPDMTERERRDRLTADLELLGRLADPTRGPLARYYPPARPQVESKACPAASIAPWRRGLAALARIQRVRVNRPETAWSLLTEHRPVDPLT